MSENTTKKEQAWLLPNRENKELKSGLYLVATPIGNLGDITLRALDTLSACDIVVCEDTRVSKKLLSYYGIQKKLVSYNDHNAAKQRGLLLEKLSHGQRVALVSDAGTPLISDPGFKLVQDCLDLGIDVTSVPGANAPLSALQLSGLPSDKFCFLGFLPSKEAAREKMLQEWKGVQASLIAFETAPRLLSSLESIKKVLGERQVSVVREITKLYEEARHGKVIELIKFYEEEGAPKGEIVLVIGGASQTEFSDEDIEEKLKEALSTMSTKEAASHVVELTGKPRKELYERALKINETSD